MITKLEVERERAIELDMQGNSLSFDDFLDDILVRGKSRFELVEFPLKTFDVTRLYLQKNLKTRCLSVLFLEL